MKKYLGIFILLLSFSALGQKADSLFEMGNSAYTNGEFEAAISLYDSIANEGYESAELYYNLGNAYYKTNQLGMAILNYERAAKLSPHDEDVLNNLKIAQESTIDKFEQLPEPIFKTTYMWIMKLFSPSGWSVMAVILFILMAVGCYFYLFSSMKRPAFILGMGGLVLGGLCLVLAFAYSSHRSKHVPAIIMSASSYVKSAPSETAEDVFILHEGTKTEVLDELEGWKKIRLIDGKIGWIEGEDLMEI